MYCHYCKKAGSHLAKDCRAYLQGITNSTPIQHANLVSHDYTRRAILRESNDDITTAFAAYATVVPTSEILNEPASQHENPTQQHEKPILQKEKRELRIEKDYINKETENASVTHILDTHVPKQYINRNNVISTEPYVRTYDELVHVERQNTDVPHTNYDYVAHVNNYNT